MASNHTLTPIPRMALSQTAELTRLLLRMFSDAAEMKRFIRSFSAWTDQSHRLPADSVSGEVMADAIACTFERDGIASHELFSAIEQTRPRRRTKIWMAEKKLVTRIIRPFPAFGLLLGGAFFVLGCILYTSSFSRAASLATVPTPSLDVQESADLPPLALVTRVTPFDAPFASDRTQITIVSATSDRVWKSFASSYRSAESVARELFCIRHLKGDPEVCKLFLDDKYWLCSGGHVCYDSQQIGKIVKSRSETFYVGTSGGGGRGCHPRVMLRMRERIRCIKGPY